MLGNIPSLSTEQQITVLLIDDQAIIGEAVRRMLASDSDIDFHFCNNPAQAIQKAIEISPTVILQDLVMPEIDGLMLLKFFRANVKTRDIPMIVLSSKEEVELKAEAFAIGANDYLVKLPDKIELIARIRYHSRAYINLLQRNQAYKDLQIQKSRLEAELAQAADYVRSLLPNDLNSEVTIRSCFRPSTELGGDSFDYYWLDGDRLVVYLLDVSGHGVGAALLSVSILNLLRTRSLRSNSAQDAEPVDFGIPSAVLAALNESFQMSEQNDLYFTIWYGVYNKRDLSLIYASGGHPPAVLLSPNVSQVSEAQCLKTHGLPIGMISGVEYQDVSCQIEPASKLYIFSDGAYEITQKDNSVGTLKDLTQVLIEPNSQGMPKLEQVLASAIAYAKHGSNFEDDLSLLELSFN
jgi:phosphoserine phosphatase RsbU/P